MRRRYNYGNREQIFTAEPYLYDCIESQLRGGAKIFCQDCSSTPKLLGFVPGLSPGEGELPLGYFTLCDNKFSELGADGIARVIIHEAAHSCGWNHGDGGDIPGDDGVMD